MFGIFLFEIKILLFEFLEHLPYHIAIHIWHYRLEDTNVATIKTNPDKLYNG